MTRAAAALALVLSLAACGGDAAAGDARLRVFAASSLSDVLPRIDPDATYNFAGSDALATQIREGAEADVFVSAGPRPARDLAAEGLLRDKRIAVFATNRLVLVTPRDDPAGVASFSDLARPGVRLVLADEGVPAGDYARDALVAAGAEAALANVVSYEDDVKGVLGKVSLGEADAGVVYATDALAAGDEVRVVPIPAGLQPRIEYLVGVVAGAKPGAQGFVDRLLGEDGRRALEDAGFGLP